MYSSRSGGGSGGKAAIAASYFGSRVFYSGRVADDDNGRFYIEDMKKAGVTTCKQKNYQGITGKCLVLVTLMLNVL